jgi:hypothetical protein
MTRFALCAALVGATLAGLGSTGRKATAAEIDSLASDCKDVPRITLVLGEQILSVPRKDLKTVQGQGSGTIDPHQGCPNQPLSVSRLEIGGPGPAIQLTPSLPPASIAAAVAYLTQMRGSDRCVGPDRLVCHVSETHGGRAIGFRYVFEADARQTMSDGAPAHARCLEGTNPVCLVDMNDPRGFHAMMTYPIKSFGPAQVGSIAGGVRERLKDIVGRTETPGTQRAILAVAAPGTTPAPTGWIDRRNCQPGRISITLGGRTRTIERADVLMVTTDLIKADAADLGCPSNPIPLRSLILQDGTGPITVQAGDLTPSPNPSATCVPADGMSRCPVAAPPGERDTTLYRASGSFGASMLCRTLDAEPYPRCETQVARAGLIARRIVGVPKDGNQVVSWERSLQRALDKLAL